MQNNYRDYNVGELLDAMSILIGLQNLSENRQQSAANDVHKANDEQANYLLEKLEDRFDNLNDSIINLHTKDVFCAEKTANRIESIMQELKDMQAYMSVLADRLSAQNDMFSNLVKFLEDKNDSK